MKTFLKVPSTVFGGKGNIDEIAGLIRYYGIIGVAAGSLFVFKGKYRVVLINYPSPKEKEVLISKHSGWGQK